MSSSHNIKRVTIITGVSGSGKTTIGRALAKRLGIPFYDGDEFHPSSNITKLSSGIPLTNEDRQPWLKTINTFIQEHLNQQSLVVSCSALKESYRVTLSDNIEPSLITWVHLQGDYHLIYERMQRRGGHFMGAAMLLSQIEAYELPVYGIVINVNQNHEEIMSRILSEIVVSKANVGLVGLGIMGTSLARNIARNGFALSVYNRHVEGIEENIANTVTRKYPELNQSGAFDDLSDFVASLQSPKKIILMINAGKPVDDLIQKLIPLLQPGDVIVDGGNSHYKETASRQKQLEKSGIHFLGAGISGGEEGALVGPSIMVGGSLSGFDSIKTILLAIAAKNNLNETCCDYIGAGGAGHFVKMVHNGIEYSEMQLIAEFYSHLRNDQKKDPEEIAEIFKHWNSGDTGSYLLGITIEILKYRDKDGCLLIDKIKDSAGNKGTGSWTTVTACELGVPIPAMSEALFARFLSYFKDDRISYSDLFKDRDTSPFIENENLLHAYSFCRIINHYQGFKLIERASEEFAWNIDTAALLKIWSGGCIIHSTLFTILRNGWSECQSDILRHPYAVRLIQDQFSGIKKTISSLTLSNQAFPVTASCLEYFKYVRSARSNAYMIQAQRDFFGAHTYQRIDDLSGTNYHTHWSKPKSDHTTFM